MLDAERAIAAGISPDRLRRAHLFLDDAVKSRRIPGAALLVARGGVALSPYCVGRLRLDADAPIRPDTIFLIASVTKPVVVSAVLLLVERGKLLLDDPVVAVIPEFGNRGKEAIRVRHLMTHTSGLPDMAPDNIELRKRHAPFSEFIRSICEITPDFPPGTNIQYQSSGIALLGEIVARLSGVSLPEFLRREIFEPLELNSTALGRQNLPVERIAHVNVGADADAQDWTWNNDYWQNFGAPWGGMFSTVEEMFGILQMFLNGGELEGVPIFSPATVAAMTADQTSAMPDIPASVRAAQGWGLGWQVKLSTGWSWCGDLLSPSAFGHGGATGTVVWADPVREMVCVLFTTQPADGSSGALLRRCSNLVAASAI